MVEITKVPQAPAHCLGVINLRGKVIAVTDLRKKLGMEAMEWNKSTRIVVYDVGGLVTGMIVDAVEEVLRIPNSTIEPTPGIAISTTSDYVHGVARVEGRLLLLLDISEIAVDVNESLVCSTNSPLCVVSEVEPQ